MENFTVEKLPKEVWDELGSAYRVPREPDQIQTELEQDVRLAFDDWLANSHSTRWRENHGYGLIIDTEDIEQGAPRLRAAARSLEIRMRLGRTTAIEGGGILIPFLVSEKPSSLGLTTVRIHIDLSPEDWTAIVNALELRQQFSQTTEEREYLKALSEKVAQYIPVNKE